MDLIKIKIGEFKEKKNHFVHCFFPCLNRSIAEVGKNIERCFEECYLPKNFIITENNSPFFLFICWDISPKDYALVYNLLAPVFGDSHINEPQICEAVICHTYDSVNSCYDYYVVEGPNMNSVMGRVVELESPIIDYYINLWYATELFNYKIKDFCINETGIIISNKKGLLDLEKITIPSSRIGATIFLNFLLDKKVNRMAVPNVAEYTVVPENLLKVDDRGKVYFNSPNNRTPFVVLAKDPELKERLYKNFFNSPQIYKEYLKSKSGAENISDVIQSFEEERIEAIELKHKKEKLFFMNDLYYCERDILQSKSRIEQKKEELSVCIPFPQIPREFLQKWNGSNFFGYLVNEKGICKLDIEKGDVNV